MATGRDPRWRGNPSTDSRTSRPPRSKSSRKRDAAPGTGSRAIPKSTRLHRQSCISPESGLNRTWSGVDRSDFGGHGGLRNGPGTGSRSASSRPGMGYGSRPGWYRPPGNRHAMGPLEGVRVIELAGIGPCPMTAMLLAELGADVLKIDPHPALWPRSRHSSRAPAAGAQPPFRRGESEASRGGRAGALTLRGSGDPHRGLSPGCDRAPRNRTGALPGPKPATGVRAGHRLGTERPARARRRARPQLHRAHRRALRDRPRRPGPRPRLSIWWEISAGAPSTSPLGWSPPSSKRGAPGRDRWWTRRWSTAPLP